MLVALPDYALVALLDYMLVALPDYASANATASLAARRHQRRAS
jgi:hypothetical protein